MDIDITNASYRFNITRKITSNKTSLEHYIFSIFIKDENDNEIDTIQATLWLSDIIQLYQEISRIIAFIIQNKLE